MNQKKIRIGKPAIRKSNGKSTLYAPINDSGINKEIRYTVDEQWEKYLTTEKSDAFVVAMLYYAMYFGLDVEWETPCSRQLIYQLKTYYLPVCASSISFFHSIKLIGPTTDMHLPCENAVGTGFSGGVDSLYTIRKYMDTDNPDMKLTHLVFTDWFIYENSTSEQYKFVRRALDLLPELSNQLGTEFLYVHCEIDQDFSIGQTEIPGIGIVKDTGMHPLKYVSVAMAMQKLFSVYLFSSGCRACEIKFNDKDMAYHDMFTLPLASTKYLILYNSGMEKSRIEKVRFLGDWEFAKKHLQVCNNDSVENCGHCSKCIRTMCELDIVGVLDNFRERFPVEEYRRRYVLCMVAVLYEAKWKHHADEQDILRNMKEKNMRIPFISYLLFPFYIIIQKIWNYLRFAKWARKIYRKFHLDRIIYGKDTYNRYVDGEEK